MSLVLYNLSYFRLHIIYLVPDGKSEKHHISQGKSRRAERQEGSAGAWDLQGRLNEPLSDPGWTAEEGAGPKHFREAGLHETMMPMLSSIFAKGSNLLLEICSDYIGHTKILVARRRNYWP